MRSSKRRLIFSPNSRRSWRGSASRRTAADRRLGRGLPGLHQRKRQADDRLGQLERLLRLRLGARGRSFRDRGRQADRSGGRRDQRERIEPLLLSLDPSRGQAGPERVRDDFESLKLEFYAPEMTSSASNWNSERPEAKRARRNSIRPRKNDNERAELEFERVEWDFEGPRFKSSALNSNPKGSKPPRSHRIPV